MNTSFYKNKKHKNTLKIRETDRHFDGKPAIAPFAKWLSHTAISQYPSAVADAPPNGVERAYSKYAICLVNPCLEFGSETTRYIAEHTHECPRFSWSGQLPQSGKQPEGTRAK